MFSRDKSLKGPYSQEFVPTPFGSHWFQSRLVGSGKTVLEVGCGFGAVSRELQRNGCKVYGIELNPKRARIAAQFCEEVMCRNIEEITRLEFEKKEFECILLGDVLEHLINPDVILNRLGEFLAPHGRIILSVPNIANWSVRWDFLKGKFEYQSEGLLDKTHLRFFTFRSINQMIQECGYRVLFWNVTQGITTVDFDRMRVRPWYLSPVSHRFQGKKSYEHVLNSLSKTLPSLFAYQLIFELGKQDHWALRT